MVNIGDTFIMYNQQSKGNKRELIQLGAPIFGQIKEAASSNAKLLVVFFLIYIYSFLQAVQLSVHILHKLCIIMMYIYLQVKSNQFQLFFKVLSTIWFSGI